MVKPDAGWLHDDRALNAGRGVFVQFTVTWPGSIELPSSIRGMGVHGLRFDPPFFACFHNATNTVPYRVAYATQLDI